MCNIVECGICLSEHSDKFNCHVCGAFGPVQKGHRKVYYNASTGVEMARGMPKPMHKLIERLFEEK